MLNRREFLELLAIGGAGLAVFPTDAYAKSDPWKSEYPRILARIRAPKFRKKDFVITNFGMWLFSGFYPRTLAGLEACYVAAIPFFQNTVAGDLFYAALLFGGFKIAELLVPRLSAGKPQAA